MRGEVQVRGGGTGEGEEEVISSRLQFNVVMLHRVWAS